MQKGIANQSGNAVHFQINRKCSAPHLISMAISKSVEIIQFSAFRLMYVSRVQRDIHKRKKKKPDTKIRQQGIVLSRVPEFQCPAVRYLVGSDDHGSRARYD